MPPKFLFSFLFFVLNLQLFAQTKWIAHRSHSGSDAHFSPAATNGLFDDGSNFGLALPKLQVKKTHLDSVIYVSDSVVVMVIRELCQYRGSDQKAFWRTGMDTVYSQPLFSSGYSVKKMKKGLKRDYQFSNPSDSVVFIGFNRMQKKTKPPAPRRSEPAQNQQQLPPQQQQQNENVIMPVLPHNEQDQPPAGFPGGLMIAIIGCLSVLAGFFSWLYYRLKTNEKLV